MKSYYHLTEDQLKAIEVASTKSVLLVAKPGSGKTICAATAIVNRLNENPDHRVLIVTTPAIANTVWVQTFSEWEHTNHIKAAYAGGGVKPKERQVIFEDLTNQVIVTTFNLLPWVKKLKYFTDFQGLVIDETTKLTHLGGTHLKSIRPATQKFPWRIGLTGTPVGESALSLYPQLLLTDLGETFGRSKDRFLKTWAYPEDFKRRKWSLFPHRKQEFYRTAMKNIHVIPDYRSGLPKIIEETIELIPPNSVTQSYYTFMKTKSLPGMKSTSAGTDEQKKAQIASGFYYDDDGKVVWISKYRVLAVYDEVLHSEGNVIIVFNYLAEKELLQQHFPEAVLLNTKTSSIVVPRWNAGEISVLLVHPSSVSHGIELQYGGHEIIWLSNQYSNDKIEQLNARVWRRGQRNDVMVKYFETMPIDVKMAGRIEEKKQFDVDFNKEVV